MEVGEGVNVGTEDVLTGTVVAAGVASAGASVASGPSAPGVCSTHPRSATRARMRVITTGILIAPRFCHQLRFGAIQPRVEVCSVDQDNAPASGIIHLGYSLLMSAKIQNPQFPASSSTRHQAKLDRNLLCSSGSGRKPPLKAVASISACLVSRPRAIRHR